MTGSTVKAATTTIYGHAAAIGYGVAMAWTSLQWRR